MAEEYVVSEGEHLSVHSGHRKRVRERFRREGINGFAPHEVLELILFYGRARGDVNPLAHQLIRHFGSLRSVLEADVEQLLKVPGVGEETATLLAMMVPIFRRYAATLVEEQKVISNRLEAIQFCCALQAERKKECFFVICLNAGGKVLGQRLVAEGSLDEVAAYPRVVVETALNFSAHSIVLCHNHTSDSVSPSKADIETTRNLEGILGALGIELLDHIIVAGNLTFSMARHGIIRAVENIDYARPDVPAGALSTRLLAVNGIYEER